MNTKQLLATTVLLASLPLSSFAEEAVEQDINYGDPTASFTTVGLSRASGQTQLNTMYGAGNHIFQLDLGLQDEKSPDNKYQANYRGRYFYVTDGLGASVDVIGDRDSTTTLAGLIYKMPITDNVMIFPMASLGYTKAKNVDYLGDMRIEDGSYSSSLGQVGIYAMYAFDAGHWLYANPKTNYLTKDKEWIHQIELGGGYMVHDWASVGFKVEHTAEHKMQGITRKADTVGWLQANVYF